VNSGVIVFKTMAEQRKSSKIIACTEKLLLNF